jgi:hypothetical protein
MACGESQGAGFLDGVGGVVALLGIVCGIAQEVDTLLPLEVGDGEHLSSPDDAAP